MPAHTIVKVASTFDLSNLPLGRALAGRVQILPASAGTAGADIHGLILAPGAPAASSLPPGLPVANAETLAEPAQLEHFLMRVQAHAAWYQLRAAGLSRGALIDFHSRYKYQLMACSPQAYRELGRQLGEDTGPLEPVAADTYFRALMAALTIPPTPGRHANVLMHLGGYFRRQLSVSDRQALERSILAYRRGEVARSAPLALLRQHLDAHPNPYLSRQVYLQSDFQE